MPLQSLDARGGFPCTGQRNVDRSCSGRPHGAGEATPAGKGRSAGRVIVPNPHELRSEGLMQDKQLGIRMVDEPRARSACRENWSDRRTPAEVGCGLPSCAGARRECAGDAQRGGWTAACVGRSHRRGGGTGGRRSRAGAAVGGGRYRPWCAPAASSSGQASPGHAHHFRVSAVKPCLGRVVRSQESRALIRFWPIEHRCEPGRIICGRSDIAGRG